MRILSFKTFSVFSGSHEEPQLQNCVKLWWTWWGWGCVCMCLCVCLCVYIVQVRVEMGGNCLWNKPKKSTWPVKLASVLSSTINHGPKVLCPPVHRQSLLWPFTGTAGVWPKVVFLDTGCEWVLHYKRVGRSILLISDKSGKCWLQQISLPEDISGP